jgi:VWFA-related protein
VYVSVVDRSGNPVDDLGPSDFVVREDNVAREILRVAPAEDPLQIALLVDNSQAAERYIRDYREAITAFVTAMTSGAPGVRNNVAIITVAERPTVNIDYSADTQQLVKGAQRIFAMPGSGSYMLDGIIETSNGVLKRRAARPVIVAVATAGPELSDRSYTQVLDRLQASGASMHVVTVGGPVSQQHDMSIALSQGTASTGGRYDDVLASTALPAKMKQLAAELTHQYRVTYARPDSLIPPEHVVVSTPRPGLTARGISVIPDREQDNR